MTRTQERRLKDVAANQDRLLGELADGLLEIGRHMEQAAPLFAGLSQLMLSRIGRQRQDYAAALIPPLKVAQ